jgi:hypothetical protein
VALLVAFDGATGVGAVLQEAVFVMNPEGKLTFKEVVTAKHCSVERALQLLAVRALYPGGHGCDVAERAAGTYGLYDPLHTLQPILRAPVQLIRSMAVVPAEGLQVD